MAWPRRESPREVLNVDQISSAPIQPTTMTAPQLAAVSFLARYAGHTHEVYTYQLRLIPVVRQQ